jgi:type IV secretion system protein VirB10
MTQEEIQTAEPEENFDPHRFDAEPKRKSNKTVVVILVIFVVLMTLIGSSVFITKKYLSSYMTERAEKRAEEKAKKEAEEDQGRKGKQFTNIPVAAPAALPIAFGKTQEGSAAPAEGAVAATTPPPAEPAPPPPPPPPGLMDDEIKSDVVAGGGAAAVQGLPGAGLPGASTQPRAKTVEQLAQQQAQEAPLTSTLQVTAANLGDRSYLLARGSFIPCVLQTQLVSTIQGNSTCVLPQNVYSDDGKVLLLEKGSSIIGQYKSDLKTGDNRIAVLWQRIKTANGVVIDVDSPAADQVGANGMPGFVDNHWMERIGAAFLLSLVEDAVQIQVAKESQGSSGSTSSPSATYSTTTSLSEKVLDSTINIPPTLYKNRGDRVMVFVNRDLWFNNVYKLTQR